MLYRLRQKNLGLNRRVRMVGYCKSMFEWICSPSGNDMKWRNNIFSLILAPLEVCRPNRYLGLVSTGSIKRYTQFHINIIDMVKRKQAFVPPHHSAQKLQVRLRLNISTIPTHIIGHGQLNCCPGRALFRAVGSSSLLLAVPIEGSLIRNVQHTRQTAFPSRMLWHKFESAYHRRSVWLASPLAVEYFIRRSQLCRK